MLILSRRERERIRLGDSIVLTVIRVQGEKVRLGIEAPREVRIVRDELEPLPAGLGAPEAGPGIPAAAAIPRAPGRAG